MAIETWGRAVASLLLAFAVMVAAVSRSSATEEPLSGLYVGGFFAYNWGQADVDVTLPAPSNGSVDLNGAGGTVLVGYRFPWLHHHRMVLGIEADGTFTDQGGSFANRRYATDYLVTLRAVTGVVISPHLTWTATVGIGWLGLNTAPLVSAPGSVANRSSDTQVGVVLGTGLEYLTHYGFIVRGDYLYGSFNSWSFNDPADERSIDPTVHQFRIGVVVPLYDRWDEYYKH